jgi:lactoylglutathione lyase
MSTESPIKDVDARMRHTMLPVKDIEKSKDFYHRLLGMNIMRERVNQKKKAMAYVGYGSEDTHPCLELIEMASDAPTRTINPWDGHIALAVTRLYDICAFLEKEGVTFKQAAGPVGPGRKDLVAFLHDPDGYEVELTERASGTLAVSS